MIARLAVRLSRLMVALLALATLVALLVGVPWGLVTFIGWPLPDHIPTSDEIEATLLNPLSVTSLLDILACIAWPTWVLFVVDVARCVPDAVRGVRPPAIGPVHAVASALVAGVVLGILQPRMPATASARPATPVPAVLTIHDGRPPSRTPASDTNKHAEQDTVLVQPPQDGTHDSLWRIGERTLGDGRRWVDLYQLNQGRPQPDGDTLRDPDLIQPGWILQIPSDTTAQPPPLPQTAAPPASAPSVPARPSPAQPAPHPTHERLDAPAPRPVITTSGTAISLRNGGLVASTVASAVAAAMVIRRRKRRRIYQPGSGDRTPPPAPAPAVHALQLAHDENQPAHTEPALVTLDWEQLDEPAPQEPVVADNSVEIGVRDDRARAIDLAEIQGLGLTGAGAEATARSLLVHLLAATHPKLIIPAEDARALLGSELPDSVRLHVADDLDSAVRALADHATEATDEPTGLMTVLVARVDGPHPQLQSILNAGSATGVASIVLGHWQFGATVRVRADGIVAAASPAIDGLRGGRLFHLNATDTRDLLALLADAPSPSAPLPNVAEPAVEEHDVLHDQCEHEAECNPDQQQTRDDEAAAPVDSDTSTAAIQQDDSGEVTESEQPVRPTTTADEAETQDTSTQAELTAPTLVDAAERARVNPDRPWVLSIFGSVTLTWHNPYGDALDVTHVLAPKLKALLVFLALHPSGTTRAAIREALWPDIRSPRPFNAFYAAVSQLRKVLDQAIDDQFVDFLTQRDEQVALNRAVVEVDYWQLHDAEHQRRLATNDDERMTAWSRIAAVYHGELANEMSAVWMEGPREAAHRAAVDALAGMAAYHRSRDPQRQLQLLEHARLLDPDNEAIYRDIMRAQAHLGYTDAIARTVQLLTTTLAEIGERPDPSTLTLARALQTRHQRMVS